MSANDESGVINASIGVEIDSMHIAEISLVAAMINEALTKVFCKDKRMDLPTEWEIRVDISPYVAVRRTIF